MKMGEHSDEFRGRLSKDQRWKDKIWVIVDRLTKSTHFFSREEKRQYGFSVTLICEGNCEDLWGTDLDSVRQRYHICIIVLEGYASIFGYTTEHEYRILFSDRWTD